MYHVGSQSQGDTDALASPNPDWLAGAIGRELPSPGVGYEPEGVSLKGNHRMTYRRHSLIFDASHCRESSR